VQSLSGAELDARRALAGAPLVSELSGIWSGSRLVIGARHRLKPFVLTALYMNSLASDGR